MDRLVGRGSRRAAPRAMQRTSVRLTKIWSKGGVVLRWVRLGGSLALPIEYDLGNRIVLTLSTFLIFNQHKRLYRLGQICKETNE
jgi:hypothetical protein